MPLPRAWSGLPVVRAALLRRVVRSLAIAAIVLFAGFCALLLAVRFVVFPRVEDYRVDLAAALAAQLAAPVQIDALDTGWDGWNPKLTVRGLRVRNAAGAELPPLLDLPQVDLVVAWTSIPLLDLRLKELAVERPRLSIRRDRSGILHLAGIELDPNQVDNDTVIADWILRQPHIVVHDAVIAWNDDLRNAPQLLLEHVDIRLDSRFGRHRFGLVGSPPADVAAPIDIRGDVRGGAHGDWRHASGSIYVRLDYADLARFSEWLPMPVPVDSGKGALRLWLNFAEGETAKAVADLELADVRTRLAPSLPPLELVKLSGRAGWTHEPPRQEFFAQSLAFTDRSGAKLEPTNLRLTLRAADPKGTATGLLEFDRLQLAPLRDVATRLPLPDALRRDLALFAPRGTLSRGRILWEGPEDKLQSYSASAEFSDVGISAIDNGPGVRGVTGRLELTQKSGEVRLSSRNAVLQLPKVFAEPVRFDSLDAEFGWQRAADRTSVTIKRVEFANRDAAGTVSGTYRTAPNGPGEIDLAAQLSRANVNAVHRYMPLVVDAAVRDWLRDGLVQGTSSDARMKLTGDLAAFPFADGKGGQFTVRAAARNVILNYHGDWPKVTELDGEFGITNGRLSVDASRGNILGMPAGRATAEIDNIAADHPVLRIALDAPGSTDGFLRFIEGSPVAGWLEHLTDGARASGNGRLDLALTFPLGNPDGNRVAGTFHFLNDDVQLVGVPPLAQVAGTLTFTEGTVRASDLTAQVLGGPARFAIASGDDQVRVTGGGTATVAGLRQEYNPPLGDTLSGSLDWTIALGLQGNVASWTIDSNLKGTAIDLPAPLGKTAAEAVALKVERRAAAKPDGDDALTITYGNVGRLALLQRHTPGPGTADRGLLLLGRLANAAAGEKPERAGLWIRGDVPVLSIDDLLALRRWSGESADERALPVAGIDLDVGILEAGGRRFHDLHVGARRSRDDWRLDLRARELAGNATWSAPSANAPNGLLTVRLARLARPDASELSPWKGPGHEPAPKAQTGDVNAWPAIDLAVDDYLVRGRKLGRLEFVASPRTNEWRIDRLALSNDAGQIVASGQWRSGQREQTILDIALEAKEAGKFLAYFGYPDALQHAPTRIKGQLNWTGAPNEFDFPSLGGAFRVDVGNGRFTKVDPGVGKLLGVLSLQALPRRLTLDFTDVFSDGFAFDEITGNVTVERGVLATQDLRLSGPAAKILIAGTADLASETQQLTVRVQPALSGSVSAGAMLLLFANPVVGAAVGAGTLLAQTVLRDPIEQIFTYEYRVTGSWSDPVVVKNTPTPAPGTAETARP